MIRARPAARAKRSTLAALLRDRKGATAVEYGLILALIVLTIMASLIAFGTTSTDMWNNISDKVRSANGG